MKTFKFGERRPDRPNDNVGPGHYSPERAELVVKTQSPSFKMGLNKSPSRPDTLAHPNQGQTSPGQYDNGKKFGDDAKSFKIGEKRPEKPNDNVGPGHYSPERAERVVKSHTPSFSMPISPARPTSFANPSHGPANISF